MKADLVLRGGRVFRGLAEGFAESLAIRGDRIVARGSDGDLAPLVGPRTTVVDLGGRSVRH